jgi:hypothetical protein
MSETGANPFLYYIKIQESQFSENLVSKTYKKSHLERIKYGTQSQLFSW